MYSLMQFRIDAIELVLMCSNRFEVEQGICGRRRASGVAKQPVWTVTGFPTDDTNHTCVRQRRQKSNHHTYQTHTAKQADDNFLLW